MSTDDDVALGMGREIDTLIAERDALRARLAAVIAMRDRLAEGNPVQTTAAEYITDALA